METTEKYPIDFDKLQKGSVIGVDTLTTIFKLGRENSRYNLECMRLAETVRIALEERGICASVCIRKGAIHILDDAGASAYERSRHYVGIKTVKRSYRRLVKNVDVRNLTPEQLKAHDAGVLRNGWVISQISTMPSLPALRAHQSLMAQTGVGLPNPNNG